jgi:hypothetical protein
MRTPRALIPFTLAAAAVIAGATSSGAAAVPACDAGETTLSSNISKVSGLGTAPTLLACQSGTRVFLRTYDNLSMDIAGTGVTDETVLRMQVTLPISATTVNTFVTGWASNVERSGLTLTITASPRTWSDATNCVPGACNVETAGVTFQSFLGSMVNLPGSQAAAASALLNGGWVSTGANAFGVLPGLASDTGAACAALAPSCLPSVQIAMSGPHRHIGGALNRAYFRAFLPTNLVQAFMGGVGPADLDLIRQEASAAAGVEISGMRCDPAAGGILCTYDAPDAHFSAPVYSIRKAPALPAGGATPGATPGATGSPASGATAAGPRRLAAVTGARATASKRAVRVTWTASVGALPSQLYRVVLRNKKKSASKTVAGTSTTFGKLARGTWKGTVTPVAATGSLEGAATGISVRVK